MDFYFEKYLLQYDYDGYVYNFTDVQPVLYIIWMIYMYAAALNLNHRIFSITF